MLRISVVEDSGYASLRLEGRLVNDWIHETREAWSKIQETALGRRVIVDLVGITFIDDRGRELLEDMQAAGARLRGSGPMVLGVIDEIRREAKGKKRSRVTRMLLMMVGAM